MRIFLSSTFEDLGAHRKVVAESLQQLDHDVVDLSNGGARPRPPIAECLREIEECDLYLGVIAWRYGSLAENSKQRRSFTEMEYDFARELGMDCLVYLVEDTYEWSPAQVDADQARVRAFRAKLCDQVVVARFSSPENLGRRVVQDLAKHQGSTSRQAPIATKPTGPSVSRLPGPVASFILGMLPYLRGRSQRIALNESLVRTGFSSLFSGDSFRLSYHAPGIDAPSLASSPATVVAGPAGVGKTSYIAHLLADQTVCFDFIVLLRGVQLRDSRGTADEILNYFRTAQGLSRRTLSPLAVGYGLRFRRVLYVVEDAHLAGDLRTFLLDFRRCLEQLGILRANSHILVTTRERNGRLEDLKEYGASVVRLAPLAPPTARELFFRLCETNGVSPADLVAAGARLAVSFDSETLRTPLYVVVAAYLAAPTGASLGVDAVLSKTPTEVIEAFLHHLYIRAGLRDSDRRELRSAYEEIAYSFWPDWRGCRAEAIEEVMSTLKLGTETPVSVSFLEQNGFLTGRWPALGTRLDFPHQTIADYLSARRMVRTNDFSKLTWDGQRDRTDELVCYLSEMIDDADTMSKLCQSDLLAFARVSIAQRALKGRPIPFMAIVKQMASWARGHSDSKQDGATWRQIQQELEGRVTTLWTKHLRDELGDARIQPDAISALAILESTDADSILVRALSDDSLIDEWKLRTTRPEVDAFLWREARNLNGLGGLRALALLWSLPRLDTDICDLTKQWLGQLKPEHLDTLAQCGPRGFAILAYAASDSGLPMKQHFSSVLARHRETVLIFPGEYRVLITDKNGNDRPQIVRVKTPFLSAKKNVTVQGRFKSPKSLQRQMQQQMPGRRPMTHLQARVTATYYSADVIENGVLFNDPRISVPEIFIDSDGSEKFYVLPNKETTAVVEIGSSALASEYIVKSASFRALETLPQMNTRS